MTSPISKTAVSRKSDLVDIYAVNREYTNRFTDLCESLVLAPDLTEKVLEKTGFTHYGDSWYYCRSIDNDEFCPSTLNVKISNDLKEISEIVILDENLLQPCVCTKHSYSRAVECINQLKKKGVFNS